MVKQGNPSIPVFVYGAPGIGKTEIVNAVGKKMGMKVYTFIASTMDPSDVRGIPMPNKQKGYADWFPPKEFVHDENKEPAIYFFDELNMATQEVRAAFYQLILSGKLGDIDISNSLRVGAGNQRLLVPEVRGAWLGTPLATRFNIYWMLPDLSSWLNYAKAMHNGKPRVNPVILDFITDKKIAAEQGLSQLFYCVNSVAIDCMGQLLATPRGWVKLSDMIDHDLTTLSDFQSALGVKIGKIFYTYYLEHVKKLGLGEREERTDLGL